MRFDFPRASIDKAMARQYDGQGLGDVCAKCGGYINPLEDIPIAIQGRDYEAIPIVPIEEGGKSADNCAVVCPKCFKKVGQDGTKEIPFSELPYFGSERRR